MLSFRQARPEDSDAVIALIYSAGPELYDYFNTPKDVSHALEFIRYQFSKGSGFCNYKMHTVALFNDEVVGIGGGIRQQLLA